MKNKTAIFIGIIVLLLSLLGLDSTLANEKENIIYKYKKYERFDLGNLEV